jgi:large subunit ribosomal protein L4
MSLSLTVQDPTSDKAVKSASKIELPAEVFDVALNIPLIHQVVVGQLASARQGTSSTKTRGEVRGGGKKPYRQKGTGRARQGSTRAPQFTGGGVVHGPQPRSYEQRTPKKMKAAALRGALSDRARNDRVHVVSSLVAGDEPSTKTAAATLAKVAESRHVLVVAERADELTWKSLRNLPAVHLLEPGQLNTYDVLISDDVVFTQSALESFLGGPATGKSAKGAATSAELEAAVEVEAEVAEVAEEAAAEPVEEPTAEKTPAKKAPAKKAAAEKATAEKTPAKKTPAKNAAAKKATAEKATADKATADKATAEKAPAKKTAAKKAPAKKAADDTSDEEQS